MNYVSLTPYQVAERTKPRQPPKNPGRRNRSNSLACYTPPGDVQASLRITGTRLEPDGMDMRAAAVYFASGLIEAVERRQGASRSLIGPARYGDKVLRIYLDMLVKGAMGERQDMGLFNPVSPALVPYLLGGITSKAVEELCYKALEVMDFLPDPPKTLTMQKALSNVGFGPEVRHEAPALEAPPKKYNHLSQRQDFLLNLPVGVGYARQLIKYGAYGDSLHRLMESWKDQIIMQTEALMDPATGEMTELAAQGRHAITLHDANYWRAVRRVFEGKWSDLDLSGRPDEAVADGEIVMARKIIQRASYNERMSAEALVGISLLTGISVANWTSFAVQDLHRRGETFITPDEIERATDMMEANPHYRCESQLRGDAMLIRRFDTSNTKWARRLQSPNWPLWSSNGVFYLIGHTKQGMPNYKHKPFSLSSDK